MTSRQQILKVIMTLMASYPAFRPRVTVADMSSAYHVILGDLDAGSLMRAAMHYASSHTFFPSAAELRVSYFELAQRAGDVPNAQDAWAEVTRALGRGFWDKARGWWEPRSPKAEDWSNALIQQAIDGIGGWRALRRSSNAMSDRARFMASYDAYLRRAQETTRMLPEVSREVARLAERMKAPMLEQRGENDDKNRMVAKAGNDC